MVHVMTPYGIILSLARAQAPAILVDGLAIILQHGPHSE
jgi:hypothetical protein